MIISELKRDNW